MVDIDSLEVFLNPEKYAHPEYYDMDKVMFPYNYYNPVLKTCMDISIKLNSDEIVIMYFENRLHLLNKDGIEELNSNIDSIIKTAIQYKRPELVAYFLDYKEKNNLYTEPDWTAWKL